MVTGIDIRAHPPSSPISKLSNATVSPACPTKGLALERRRERKEQATHDHAGREETHLLKHDRIDARLPERRIAWRLHAEHAIRQRRQPRDPRGRSVEGRDVAIHAEHPPHQRERGLAVARVSPRAGKLNRPLLKARGVGNMCIRIMPLREQSQ